MMTKKLLKEYIVDWLAPYVIYQRIAYTKRSPILSEEIAEYLTDKIWDKIELMAKEQLGELFAKSIEYNKAKNE